MRSIPSSCASLLLLISAGAIAAEKPQTIPPERLQNYWLLLSGTAKQANVPNSGRNLDAPTCAAVSYIVEKDGSTSNIELKKLVPDGDLGKVAKSVASGLHFEATAHNAGKDRVFSWLIFPFNLPADPAARTAVMKQCQIDKIDWKDH